MADSSGSSGDDPPSRSAWRSAHRASGDADSAREYIAWNGRRHSGDPPTGWYLAEDDQWWPPGYGPKAGRRVAVISSTLAEDEHGSLRPGPRPVLDADGRVMPRRRRPGRHRAIVAGLVLGVLGLGVAIGGWLLLGGDDEAPIETAADDGSEARIWQVVGGASSIDAPHPVGVPVTIELVSDDGWTQQWIITVEGPLIDSTEAVLEEDPRNEAPPPGRVFATLPLAIGLLESAAPASVADFDLRLEHVPDGELYAVYDAYCGVIPDELDYLVELPPQTSVTGQLCWSVPSSDVGRFVLRVEPYGLATPIYFSTMPPSGVEGDEKAAEDETPSDGSGG